MNDVDIKKKQQIIDKIKNSTNILITVSRNPSVDDLSAMLGLTALLNKLGKHATAIFSGAIPPAIDFLEPGKVFENSADSLRDFIIALDKEKADHLRYKVDGNMVKIFITPYRTNISSEDLEFSQGDYNIELVLALGVENQEHLDEALTAHGKVLDDVTVATFSTGSKTSQLGSMDWNDKNAGSLSEMVSIIGDALRVDKPLLDKQIATALLTGIVAATDRFSNIYTTSRVMTTAAQLMAFGADQQLIAAKLQESHEISSLTTNLSEPQTDAVVEIPMSQPEVVESVLPAPSDSLTIRHELEAIANAAEAAEQTNPQPEMIEPVIEQPMAVEQSSTLPPEELIQPADSAMQDIVEPTLGGTLNATTDQAADDARREIEDQQNTTILNHSYLNTPESSTSSTLGSPDQAEGAASVDIFANSPISTLPATEPVVGPMPIVEPPTLDMPLPPPLPDFSTLPPQSAGQFGETVINPISIAPQPQIQTQIQPIVNDPAQFRIPGQ